MFSHQKSQKKVAFVHSEKFHLELANFYGSLDGNLYVNFDGNCDGNLNGNFDGNFDGQF